MDNDDGGSTLPTGMAPLEGGFENPTLPPPLVEGTLPDFDGDGTMDKAGILVTMTGDYDVGGGGAKETTPPTIPLSAPIHHRARIAPHAHKNAPPPSPQAVLSVAHGIVSPLKARLCPDKLS
jgi:hypothetical protein